MLTIGLSIFFLFLRSYQMVTIFPALCLATKRKKSVKNL